MKTIDESEFLRSPESYLAQISDEPLAVSGLDVVILSKSAYEKLHPSITKRNALQVTNSIDPSFLDKIRFYLEQRGQRYQGAINEALDARASGRAFGTDAHIKALIYAQTSNQTQWHRIEPHLAEIDELFHHYDMDAIQEDGSYYSDALFAMKCGNRKTKSQMESLAYNLSQFRRIIAEYGSMDAFVFSKPAPEIVTMISKCTSQYKLKYLGEALAWEYLRNVGIDGAKPDLHLRRFFGAERMGASKKPIASTQEVLDATSRLSAETGYRLLEIDNLIWSFCADGYGEVCTAAPRCAICPITSYCAKHR